MRHATCKPGTGRTPKYPLSPSQPYAGAHPEVTLEPIGSWRTRTSAHGIHHDRGAHRHGAGGRAERVGGCRPKQLPADIRQRLAPNRGGRWWWWWVRVRVYKPASDARDSRVAQRAARLDRWGGLVGFHRHSARFALLVAAARLCRRRPPHNRPMLRGRQGTDRLQQIVHRAGPRP